MYWEVVSKGSRTSPEPCFDPLIFPQKSAKSPPGFVPKFFFFFGPVLGRSSLFGGIKVNEDDLHFFFFWLNYIFPNWENVSKLSDRSGLLGWRRSLPPKRGVWFAQKSSMFPFTYESEGSKSPKRRHFTRCLRNGKIEWEMYIWSLKIIHVIGT